MSAAAAGLCQWVSAVHEYATVARKLRAEMKELRKAEDELTQVGDDSVNGWKLYFLALACLHIYFIFALPYQHYSFISLALLDITA